MSGILPFASIQNPVWTPLAREIHSAIWERVGLEVVRGYVREWATTWNGKSKASAIEHEKQNELFKNEANWCSDWHPILPAVPLPPSSESISMVEKWASLAAIQDVFGFTGDKVLPWPLPKDDHDLVAYTEWLSGDARAYQLLLRRASELPESYADTLRDWLSSARKNPHIVVTSSLPKDERNGAVTKSIDHKAQTEQILNTKETDSLQPNNMTGAIPAVAEPSNSPDNKNLIVQEALRAVVDGGLAGVMRVAESAPSSQKVSEQMRNMLAADIERYWWTVDDWVCQLSCSKKTIVGNKTKGIPPCDAWKDIMAWRESNKRSRFPGKL